mmetsp:Transcript_20536/g.54423  ORF Transcript_20536/g.54423 Transcript_20536/m.54423 type:complete len:440 (-) Transcript_20536:183-1502(-)
MMLNTHSDPTWRSIHERACSGGISSGNVDDYWLEQIVSHCMDGSEAFADIGDGTLQPMKVMLQAPVAEVEPSFSLPMKVEDVRALAMESLAQENQRLAWENETFRRQTMHGHAAPMANQTATATRAAQLNASAECWWPSAGPAADPWAADYSQVEPQIGDVVCFHGLQHSVELNGAYATVDHWDDISARWVVYLPSGEEKLARPEHLTKVPPMWYQHGAGADYNKASAKQQRRLAKRMVGGSSPACSLGSESTASGASHRSSLSGGAEDGHSHESGEVQMSTVMMRNIPNDYTGAMLTELLDKQGFRGCYHLVYLPMDYCRKAAFGYAFIDLVSTEEAQRFHSHFEGFTSWDIPCSQKVCSVGWSDALQGVQAHVDRYRNSPVMHDAVPDEFKPMMFVNGVRVPFPAPTKNVRAPRLRKHEPLAHRPNDAAVLPVGALR